jgi:hypothetical protein
MCFHTRKTKSFYVADLKGGALDRSHRAHQLTSVKCLK